MLPTRGHDSDAGLDLYAAEGAHPARRARQRRHRTRRGHPDGLAGLVLPRSGLALKHGISLVNAQADRPGYRGEVRVLLHNTDLTSEFQLAAGDRVAQLILVPIAHDQPARVRLARLDRSRRRGFGSTGS